MSTTARLALPYIAPQQAQKQVTYNSAMAALDQLVQPAVKSRTTVAPPGTPAEGDTYIVAPSATGAWAGKDGKFACWLSGAWSYRTPANGWLAYVVDTAELAVLQAGSWTSFVTNGGTSLAKLGINASADLTTRLAVGADASLFTHAGTSHRLKLNKASAADTASLLFQDNLSSRAEFGLTADDAFHVKVSPNGSTWYEALNVSQSSGLVTLPIGQLAFPAVQNPSGNANTLDDYEEGTWTPDLQFGGAKVGMTYNFRVGRYTKIGNAVAITCDLQLTAVGSSTGLATIGSLPFANNASISAAGGVVAFSMSSLVDGVATFIGASGTSVSLYTGSAAGNVTMTQANFTASSRVAFSLIYSV